MLNNIFMINQKIGSPYNSTREFYHHLFLSKDRIKVMKQASKYIKSVTISPFKNFFGQFKDIKLMSPVITFIT